MAMRVVTLVVAIVTLSVAAWGCKRDARPVELPAVDEATAEMAAQSAPQAAPASDPFLAIPECAIAQAAEGAEPYLAVLRAGAPIVSSRKKLRAMTVYYAEALSDEERDVWLDKCLEASGTKRWRSRRRKIIGDLGHDLGAGYLLDQSEDAVAAIFNLAVDQVLKNKARGAWMELSQSRYANEMREYDEWERKRMANPPRAERPGAPTFTQYPRGVRPTFPKMPVWDFAAIKAECAEREK